MDQLSSKIVYSNAWMSVREDEVRHTGGSTGIYGVVDKRDCAIIAPRDGDGWWVVEQFRYPLGRRTVEFPQGAWPTGRTGTGLELAAAELREETGLVAAAMTRLGRLSVAHGFCSQMMDVFLAEELTQGAPEREATEEGMTHRWVSDTELHELVVSGSIVDSLTLAAISLWLIQA